MKGAGIAATLAGLFIALGSLLMKTSIHQEAVYRYGTTIPAADTLNLGLLQNQHLAFLGGCTLFLAGVVLFVAGTVIEALRESRPSQGSRTSVIAASASGDGAPTVDTGTEPEVLAAAKKDEMALIVVGTVVTLVVLLIAIFALANQRPTDGGSAAALVAENAEAMADRLEQQADNIDALPDTTSSGLR